MECQKRKGFREWEGTHGRASVKGMETKESTRMLSEGKGLARCRKLSEARKL